MADDGYSDDVAAIEAIIDRQFGSLNWSGGGEGDWAAFKADFLEGASLYPSARPARRQTVDEFTERMKGLARTSLQAFTERPLGSRILVFGNVAVAMAGCEIAENDREVSRGVEAMLLIKEDGAWKIVAQSWHMEDDENPLPARLSSKTT